MVWRRGIPSPELVDTLMCPPLGPSLTSLQPWTLTDCPHCSLGSSLTALQPRTSQAGLLNSTCTCCACYCCRYQLQALSAAVSVLPGLELLSLDECGLDDADVSALCR